MDADGSNAKELGQRPSFNDARLRQFDGAILDWLPDDGNALLMSRDYVPESGRSDTRLARKSDGLGVDRIDLRTLKTEAIEKADPLATGFLTDGRGNVRIKESEHVHGSTGMLTSATEYFYRPSGSSEWKKFSTYDSQTREGMIPLAVDGSIDSAYALKKLNGRFALYRVKLDGALAPELVYANDKVDVDGVVRIGRGRKVIGVSFAEEQRQAVYFDDKYKRLSASLSKALPHLPLVSFRGSSQDGHKLLIFAGSDSDPGRYYVYDDQTKGLNEIMLARPELENATLASVRAVAYSAPDGAMVPAYLTLPPGKEGKKLPTVVMPHGGPSSRDEWGFDWFAQYLAAQGYAVLQPNFRGSDGFGDAWLAQNGFQGWRTSIGDITAGAKWLAAQGIADPARTAAVGWSYGGYAALQAAATEPNLFKGIVAIAPVTDLGLLKEEAKGFTNADLVARFVGSGPHVEQGSPLRNAARISAPVLLFHGTRDLNVGQAHSRRMDRALKDAGKRSELVVFEGLEHDLEDSKARTDMLDRIGRFLAEATAAK
ncbi:MAG TPA: S9 family peptidase [Allosphingosinicella sp.]|jgi:dipeptidyl aminopeptidase/acylaminoacyl peptidase